MSLLSRASAPTATHDAAAVAAALLSLPHRAAPVQLPVGGKPRRFTGIPTGLGTSAVRLFAANAPAEKSSGKQSSGPELYCPPALRDNRALGEEVNDRLVEWAARIGIYEGQLDKVRSANFGRLIMLAHPESDDPERLLAAAKCALAEWAVDDHYVDDESAGAEPEQLGVRLAFANAVLDPVQLPVSHVPDFEKVVQDDPVLRALRDSFDNLAKYAAPQQIARLSHQLSIMFVAYNQEGDWRTSGRLPSVWEYLTHRHLNSFQPCMVLIDVVGGYLLPSSEYYDPRVRRVFAMAGTAAVIVNDLYSMAKEQNTSGQNYNLPALIANEEQCSPEEAVERTVRIHDEFVHAFEQEAAALSLTGSPMLRRFLAGVWAWMGGGREWHSTSERYHSKEEAAV